MIQEKIQSILWDRRPVFVDPSIEIPPGLDVIFLMDPTVEDRNLYNLTKRIEEQRARAEGVPTEGELLEAARESGYWGEFEEKVERDYEEHVLFLESEFEAKKKFKSRQNIIRVQIEDAKAKMDSVQRKRAELKMNSAEYLAHQIASFGMLQRVAVDSYGNRILADDEKLRFYKENYPEWSFYLLNEMLSEGVMPIVDIREIARSVEWRLVWTLQRENLSGIFDRPTGNLTLNQRLLIYWSRIYDSAIETTEPPDVDTINDDDLFDAWLANRDLEAKDSKNPTSTSHHQEQGHIIDGEYVDECTCGAKTANKGKYLGEKIPHAADCPYGTWHVYTPEERARRAQQIYGRNKQSIRELLDKEQEHILQKGSIEEQDLRSKKSRQLLGMPTKTIPIKKR